MLEKVIDILANQLRIDASTITAETDIVGDLNADSLDIVEVIMTIEQQYGVSIPDEDVATIKTVGELSTYIEKHCKK
jgi:acyl carrier protein